MNHLIFRQTHENMFWSRIVVSQGPLNFTRPQNSLGRWVGVKCVDLKCDQVKAITENLTYTLCVEKK